MSQKKAKALRKALGVTKENLKSSDSVDIAPVTKVVYFRNKMGDLIPRKTTRTQRINRNKFFYRQQKKKLAGGE